MSANDLDEIQGKTSAEIKAENKLKKARKKAVKRVRRMKRK